MCEWYANRVILARVGPHILCTYGLFVGTGMALQVLVTHAFAQKTVQSSSAAWWVSVLVPWVTVVGWRVCSVCIEDAHQLRNGRWWTALCRPGYLEAGGHVFAMAFALTVGGRAHGIALCDSVNAGYYLALTFLKLGCVSYGCCWGVALTSDTWYATRYVDANAKVLRLQPKLHGVPLFPVSSFMAALFLKNAVFCALLLTMKSYRIGMATALLPFTNALDKRLYFSKRGDAAETEGIDPLEDFRMVPAAEKRRYCQVWARCDAIPCALAWLHLFTCHPVAVAPFDTGTTTLWMASGVAFALGVAAFGYHYGRCGCWCPQRSVGITLKKR